MWLEPFPLLKACESAKCVPAFDDYLGDVLHHLQTAHRAAERCGQRAADAQLLIDPPKVMVMSFYAAGIAEAGDAAIRAAVSAVEVGLQLTNLVLDLGLPKVKVKRESVSRELKRRGATVAPLLRELEVVFDSIGWELLLAYRNWITHRGAPVVLAPLADVPREIPAPVIAADRAGSDAAWCPEVIGAINRHVLDGSEVLCWPFVPPVLGILDDEHGTPVAPGLGIALPPGSRMKLVDNLVSAGSLREDAASYRLRNPVPLGHGPTQRSGESLERYPAVHYIHAVHHVVRFADDALRGEWDSILRDLSEQRVSCRA